MCLAVPGKIVECREAEAWVDLQGNRLQVSTVLVPEAGLGDWVLVHAGFALSKVEEQDALQTWDYLREIWGGDPLATEGALDEVPSARPESP
jgi:hydrogenase expression/formation protein HypC